MSNLESVQQGITETTDEIQRIKALPNDDPDRAAFLATLPALYANLAELRKQQTILLERAVAPAQPDQEESTALKRRIAYVEHELERQKKPRNDNSHIGTRILEDPETLDEEAVFKGIPPTYTPQPQFTITMPPDNDENHHTNEIKKFLEFLMPFTDFDFHDTRNSPICDPNAKIDFIIVRKNGYHLWTELIAVIEAKGDIQNTTSHKDAVGQICDRHMEILRQQRLRDFVFGIVLDCRCVEIIKTIRSSTPAFLHYRTGLFPLFASNGTSNNERGYALLVRLLRASSGDLGFTPFVLPNPPYLFTKDGRDVKINNAILLKEGFGNSPTICLGHEQKGRMTRNETVEYVIKFGGKLDLLHKEREILSILMHQYIIELHGVANLDLTTGPSYVLLLYPRGILITSALDRIEDDKKFDKLTEWIQQVNIGFQYAHGQGIVHRDCSDDNLVIDSTGNVRIIDWGISCKRGDGSQRSFSGKPLFAALDVLSQHSNQSSDYEYEEKYDFESLFYTFIYLIGKSITRKKLPWDKHRVDIDQVYNTKYMYMHNRWDELLQTMDIIRFDNIYKIVDDMHEKLFVSGELVTSLF